MQNNKIIITVPDELKSDLTNTKALDWEIEKWFFDCVDLRNEYNLKWYFEWYKILYFELIKRLLNPLNILKKSKFKKELKEVKEKLLSLEKVFDEIYKEEFFYEKKFFSLKWGESNSSKYSKFTDFYNILIYIMFKNFWKLNLVDNGMNYILKILIYKIGYILLNINIYLKDKQNLIEILNELKYYAYHTDLQISNRNLKENNLELYNKLFY